MGRFSLGYATAALLISTTVIWAYAHLLTDSGAYKHRPDLTQHNYRTDRGNLISSAPWIKIPYPLEWGAPTFDVGHSFGMMAAVLVSLIEDEFERKRLEISSQNSTVPREDEDDSQLNVEIPPDLDIWVESFGKKKEGYLVLESLPRLWFHYQLNQVFRVTDHPNEDEDGVDESDEDISEHISGEL